MTSDLKHSPLEAAHQALGARLVPFAGWNMPVQYSSIIDEHHAVRSKVGIFDISHMGQFLVSGPAAEAWLNRMFTNNISKLAPGHLVSASGKRQAKVSFCQRVRGGTARIFKAARRTRRFSPPDE